jgi:FixJ family two-component response regulator
VLEGTSVQNCCLQAARWSQSDRGPYPGLAFLARGQLQTANDRSVMLTIAVVDDNPSMLQGLNRLLSAHGFRVRTFASAEAFLEAYVDCGADCLLLDIHLGGISGIDLQRQLISSGRELPVIMMTAIDNEVTRQEAFDAGCVAYLKKPFLSKLLIDAIGRIP